MTENKTQNAKAYDAIYQSIMEGRVLPGAWLREQDLVDELGISRTPIREALRRLATEGLLEFRPRRGTVVKKLTSSEYIEIYKIREQLEVLAYCWAAESFEDIPLERLERILRHLEEAEAELDIQLRLKLVREFFFTIFEVTEKEHLLRLLSNLWDLSHQYRRFFSGISATVPQRIEFYRRMFWACREKDEEELIAALKGLYSFVENTLIPLLNE